MKVYIFDANNDFDFRAAESIGDESALKAEAIRQGAVYSLDDFQEAINDESLWLDNSFIYFAKGE